LWGFLCFVQAHRRPSSDLPSGRPKIDRLYDRFQPFSKPASRSNAKAAEYSKQNAINVAG
jgi:hypothetical protein